MGLFNILKKKTNTSKSEAKVIQTPAFKVDVRMSIPKPQTKSEIDAKVIRVESRIKYSIPSKHGLYPHEILVLDYAHSFNTVSNSFQGFWWYKYGISDVQAILSSLTKRKFLQIGDIRSAIEKENVTFIKEVLKAHQLNLTGKKSELVQRLLDSIPENELNELFPKHPYELTDLGKTVLDDEAYILYIHRHYIDGLDIWEFNRIVYSKPILPFREKLWGYLNKLSLKYFQENNFGLYRNCRFTMSQLLIEEKNYLGALSMLAEVLFFDLSGAGNNYDPQYLYIFAEHFFPYKDSSIRTAPGIISEVVRCQKELGYSDEEIRIVLKDRMVKLHAPLQLFTVEECAQIFFYERDHNTDALTILYAKVKRHLNKNIRIFR